MVGVSACETANLFKDHIFYEYDLSLCIDEKNDETCDIFFLNKAVKNAYKTYGSPGKNIAVFRHLEKLTGHCHDIARMNLVLVTMFEGREFQDINILLLYEENLPQTPENCFQTIDQYIKDQYNLTLQCIEEKKVNLDAFFGRLVKYYVEQEPQKKECKLYRKPTLLSNFSIPVIVIIIVMIFVCLKSNKKKIKVNQKKNKSKSKKK